MVDTSDGSGARSGSRSPPGEVARAEARVDLLDAPGGPEPVDVDRLVDRVIAGHGVVLATLERDLSPGIRSVLEARRSSAASRRERGGLGADVVIASTAREARERFGSLRRDLGKDNPDLAGQFRLDRAQRARLTEGLEPTEFRPRTRAPVITRGGVFYVAPRFEQAVGIGDVSDARLIRAGFVTAEAFFDAHVDHLADLTGHHVDTIQAGKEDLDLTRLPGIDRRAADLLRVVNVHSISRLAQRDPDWLAAELGRVREQYRLWGFPPALAGSDAVARLVAWAKDMTDS